MPTPTIIFTINPDGTISYTLNNFQGTSCLQVAETIKAYTGAGTITPNADMDSSSVEAEIRIG